MRVPRPTGDDLEVPRGMNPEAGIHVVATDSLELKAGAEAAVETWNAFPYYERRYADRGRLFCNSDTAWLITRCDAGRQVAVRDVRWLGEVLSSRGMPQYLLEVHLGNLYRALVRVDVWPRKRFEPLRQAMKTLTRVRTAHMTEETFNQLASSFDSKMSKEACRVERFGVTVVAAVADSRAGIGNAVPSLRSWACDPALFSRRWVRAVDETIEFALEV